VARIIEDAGIQLVLTDTRSLGGVTSLLAGARRAEGCVVVATDGGDLPAHEEWRMPAVDADTTVLAQYTSGSTREPKGVMIGHRHLLSNAEAIRRAFAVGPEDRTVAWLPHYHDMGLMGTLLQPLYSGVETTLISPVTFLKRPHRWLELISSERATIVVAPDFAYELCTRRVSDAQLASLDLASLRVAMNGAEPIRARTLREFASRFAPAGFRPEAFAPCYGMAEITLFATAAVADRPWREVSVDPTALGRNEVKPGEDDAVTLVSSGRPVGVEVLIVDPESNEPLPLTRVGEIWLRGGHVAAGYLGSPEASSEVFDARTADGRGPYLRTGDLGFLVDGELVVTGRLKDLVVVNGRNIYPQDIEQAAREVHPALASSVSAAFGVDPAFGLTAPPGADPATAAGRAAATRTAGPAGEHVVVIQEVRPDRLEVPMPELAASIRSQVARSFEIAAPTVALVHRGVIQRTTSGKVRRRAMRELFVAGGVRHIHLEPAQGR
jgi:acyl-CoA synthetase (AMP-forming)/AMP-acid ligase II